MKIKLVYSLESNCSQRAVWAFNYKSVPFEAVKYDFGPTPEVLAVSPLGKVPAISIAGKHLAESMAIIEYLEENYPEPALLPRDSYSRAKVREVAEMVNGTVHAVQSMKVAQFFIPTVTKDQVIEFRRTWIEKHLVPLQALLFKESPFAVGKEFTLADIFVIPIFVKALGFGTVASRFPEYVKNIEHCQKNSSIWNSCPEDLKSLIKLHCK